MRFLGLIFRLLTGLAVLLLVLVVALRMLLDTDAARERLRQAALDAVPGLEIDLIRGDPWFGLRLHGIRYTDSTLTVRIDSVAVRYDLWALLDGEISIGGIDIDRPQIDARATASTSTDTSAFIWPMDLRIHALRVRDGSLRWNGQPWLRDLRIDGSGRVLDQHPSVTIDRAELSLDGLGLDSTSVAFAGRSEGTRIRLEELVLATGRTLISARGEGDLSDESVDADVRFRPLSWRDIARLAGETPVQEDLDMSLTLSGTLTALKLGLDVRTASYPRLSAGMLLTPDSLTAAGTLHTGRTPVTFTAATDWSAPAPGVDLRLNAIGFDARSIRGYEDFPTSIRFSARARIAGGDIDALLDVGPSTVNRVPLRSANATFRVSDGVLTVSQGSIRSDIIDGDIRLRQRLDDATDPANRLEASFTLLQLQPLAPLAALDSLAASGRVTATVARGEGGILHFDADLDLSDVRIDTVRIARVNSRVDGRIGDIPDWSANLLLNGLSIGGTDIPFLGIRSLGRAHPDHVESHLALEGHLSDDIQLVHEGDLDFRDGDLHHLGTRLEIRLPGERLRTEQPFDLSRTGSRWLLDGLRLIDGRGSDLELIATYDERTEQATVRFDASSVALRVNDVTIDSVRVRGLFHDNRAELQGKAWLGNAPWLDVDVSLPFLLADPVTLPDDFFDQPVRGRFTLHPMRLESVRGWMDALGMAPMPGTLRGGVILDGTAGSPTFTGDLRLLRSAISAVPIDSMGVEWSFDAGDESIRIASTLVSLGQPALDIDGRIPFRMDMRRFTPILDMRTERLDLTLTTRQFNMDALSVFTDPATVRRLQGRMNGELRLRGSFEEPKLDGRFGISGASMTLPQQNITLGEIGVDLRFEPGRVVIRDGRLRSNGLAQLSGTVDLDGFDILGMDLALKGDVLRLSDTRNASVFMSLDTRLRGRIDAPKLTGTLRLDRGTVYLEEFGENTVEQVVLEDETPGLLDRLELYENLDIELALSTERGFWVRNRSTPEMNLELAGQIDILKSKGGDIQLFGTMGAQQGQVSQLGKRFVVEKGDVTFSGSAENPQLAIRSLYELKQPNDIRIWYVIGGTLEKPDFSFESDPEMDQRDIVSYTLFNRPFQQLMSWEQTLSGSSGIGNMAVDLLVDRVGELAADRLGLDVIEIDNSRTSGNSGTTIKAGKYLNERLFLAILQELGSTSDSQVILEYALRQHLNLVLTGSDKRKSGIDIQWKYDY